MDTRTDRAAPTAWAEQLEDSRGLGGLAGQLRGPLAAVMGQTAKRALQGRAVGHAVHPLAVQLPLGALTSAIVLDMWGHGSSWRESRRLVATACLGALPSILTGMAEWLDADERTQRVGVAHAAVNAGSTLVLVASLAARSGRGAGPTSTAGMALSIAAALGFSVGGFLGGHMSLARKYATHDAPRDFEGAHSAAAG